MSRIGKKPIIILKGVEVKINENEVLVKGPKGELKKDFPFEVLIELKDDQIFISPKKDTKRIKALWGLTRALIANMVHGVSVGYEKSLQIEGVGYKAELDGNDVSLKVGFSHPVKIEQPEGIKFSIERNIISVSGIDKEKVGLVASKIRAVRPPEPYKGKGIRYVGEIVKKKAGKKVATSA